MLFRTVLVAVSVCSLPVAGAAFPAGAAPSTSTSARCGEDGSGSQRARAAFRDPGTLARAAARSGRGSAALARVADRDASLWVDGCGQPFYVEPVPDAATLARADAGQAELARSAAASAPSAAEVFALASRPGAPHTVYLDFTGHTATATAWNDYYTAGAPIVAAPYSVDADPAAFSALELANIVEAWAVVAEDYAPFDVNVTTAEPVGAFTGSRVVVTAEAAGMSARCGCAGLGYLDVFGWGSQYQPAWVFTDRSSTYGTYVGDVASHEVGHNLGLDHDGDQGSAYHAGGEPWAPIMGSPYLQPLAQWSAGEYAGATNTQDDVAVIASRLGRVVDDHVDGSAGASRLVPGSPVAGLVGSDADVDVFAFTSVGGAARVEVAGARGWRVTNLDARVVVRDAAGVVVGSADPASSRTAGGDAAGVSASVAVSLPAGSYTVTVAGVGAGDRRALGGYSGYGSLGRYTVSLTAASAPLEARPVPVSLPVGSPASGAAVAVSGGVAPYRFEASGGPAGLVVDPVSGQWSGSSAQAGAWWVRVRVVDAVGDAVSVPVPVTVASVLSWGTAARLPGGRVGVRYATRIRVVGASEPVVWQVSGAVPAGLRVVERSSVLRVVGTPTRPARSAFTVSAESGGRVVSRSFRVRVVR